MDDEADFLVVLALLQVAFLVKFDSQRLGPRGWPFSSLPDLNADCRERAVITSSPPAWTSSAYGMEISAD